MNNDNLDIFEANRSYFDVSKCKDQSIKIINDLIDTLKNNANLNTVFAGNEGMKEAFENIKKIIQTCGAVRSQTEEEDNAILMIATLLSGEDCDDYILKYGTSDL